MAGTHGDALLGEQVGEVGAVHAFDCETGQGGPRFAEDAHTVAGFQAGEQAGVEDVLVGGGFRAVQAVQPVEAGAEADYRADGRRAGFEAHRCAMELRRLVVGQAHHLAAELPVLQQVQRFRPTPEHAEAVRPVEFVAGEDVEIAAQRRQVVPAVDHALGTVHHAQRALCAGQGEQFRQRLPGAEDVG
ncbi:hypothetical protein D3C81_1021860 [compost metagenome]